ncbi:MAG: AbrB/MazE/SpoVT family DNA-binding domain-containing protein [Thermodesulfobacteriota bacterium]|nr:AbrB/MazE/SpoVT family DNA-binding domain-containing protein [Thermodesulfobacteriota bacterium]
MLAKLTVKNQITIPKKIITQLKDVQYFDVDIKDGLVLLKPVKVFKADLQGIRAKIKKLGFSEDCVSEATN